MDSHHSHRRATTISMGDDGWQNVLMIGGERYHWSWDVAKVPIFENEFANLKNGLASLQQPRLCVVIDCSKQAGISDASVHERLTKWLLSDDVLTTEFVETIVLLEEFSGENLPSETACWNLQPLENWPLLQQIGAQQILTISVDSSLGMAPSGPYVISDFGFHSVYRVYEDSQGAFFSSIQQDSRHVDTPFAEERPTAYIKVPSRIQDDESVLKLPLSNLRFGVKDVFDVQGLRTSNGCRAWYELYDVHKESSASIQMLLATGVKLVGKTKNTQFANGEDPQEWIDYSCPWNPRGDRYQNPDTSSSGSAAAVAAYDWLDFAVGSDTCGSIACPASSQGLFAIRYSTGALPSTGVFTINKRLDSMGIMTRSIDLLYEVSSNWGLSNQYQIRSEEPHLPSRILYPWSVSPHGNPHVMQTMDIVLAELENYTGVKMAKIDVEEEWLKADPSKEGVTIKSWMKNTTAHLHISGFDEAIRPFREEYQGKLGKRPYLDRVNAWKVELANKVTDEDRKNMLERQDTFTDWFNTAILRLQEDNPINTIMVWPFSPDYPIYRDQYPPLTPHVNFKWDIDYSPPLAGLPHVIIPGMLAYTPKNAGRMRRLIVNLVGQFPYESRITATTEYLPTCVAVVSAAGSDLVLLDFLNRFLHQSKLATAVKTGQLAFDI